MSLAAASAAALLDRDRMLERLTALVRTNSENPPGREAAAGELVAGFCEDMGFGVAMHEAAERRPNVVARAAFGEGPAVAYCSHIDTVPIGHPSGWARDPLGAEIADGKLWGRGACDAKGPIVAALEAAHILRHCGDDLAGTFELVLVSDEETMGFLGAGHLVEHGVVRPDAVVVGEPTSLRLVTAQRGACWIELTTRGVAAHGSAPERGVNAILHMAEVLRHVPDTLPDISHPILGGPSVNVGTITGGSKVNMVAANCTVEIDRRTIPGEATEDVLAGLREAIERARERWPDLDASAEVAFHGRPFEIAEGARIVSECKQALTEANGRPAEIIGFRGASDARFFAEAGAEVVVCGPGDIALAHTVRENVDLEELERAAIAYALAFARLLARASS